LIEGRHREAPLFPGRYHRRGRYHNHHYVTRYCVAPLCEALGLPRVTAHGLRGTFTDLAIEEGMASLAVAPSLGHASFGVTAAHYASVQALSDGKSRKAHAALRLVR
jgi:integrase